MEYDIHYTTKGCIYQSNLRQSQVIDDVNKKTTNQKLKVFFCKTNL